MAWRILSCEGETWHVQPAAERRANQAMWQLVLAFRRKGTQEGRRSFWASFPLESSSKSSLFLQAEKLSDEALQEVLARHLS
ncbi:MAG: hypothetical protein OEY20_11360 [Gemmatimonadota bacterium]|nr:hypothetical protein [Gemmatimonadota bacterium]MDH4350293.1 hypothetical protein [Gemmatimonadota bacterium]MDH5197838.1 hypothetical protein [Gemmatimonadota bacterium]